MISPATDRRCVPRHPVQQIGMMRVDPDSTPRYCLILDDPVAGYGSAPRMIFRRRVNFFCAVRTRSSNTKWFGAGSLLDAMLIN